MRLGERFESTRRLSILLRFAGKTQSNAMAPALRRDRFTATRLTEVLSIALAVLLRIRESRTPKPFGLALRGRIEEETAALEIAWA